MLFLLPTKRKVRGSVAGLTRLFKWMAWNTPKIFLHKTQGGAVTRRLERNFVGELQNGRWEKEKCCQDAALHCAKGWRRGIHRREISVWTL